MKLRKSLWLMAVTILSVTLSSCNLSATPAPTQDIGAIQTQAFNLVLTQVVLQSSPTPLPTNTSLPTPTLALPPTFAPVGGGNNTVTPFPFSSPLPGLGITPLASPLPTIGATTTTKNGCNDGMLVAESEPYDDDVLQRGKIFEKWFQFVNTGTCTWDEGYVFAFLPEYSTPGFKGSDILIKKVEDFVKPGSSIAFKFVLNTGQAAGTFQGTWKLRDDAGNYFGSMVHVRYIIK